MTVCTKYNLSNGLKSWLDKNLNSNLNFGQACLKVYLPEPISDLFALKKFKIISDLQDSRKKPCESAYKNPLIGN